MVNGTLISDGKPVSSKGGNGMTTKTEKLASEIQDLTDEFLSDLDKPDPEIDRIWAEEARKRWTAYKAGHIPSVPYQEVMGKYRRS
jgi:hypothetical protein